MPAQGALTSLRSQGATEGFKLGRDMAISGQTKLLFLVAIIYEGLHKQGEMSHSMDGKTKTPHGEGFAQCLG